MSYRSSALVGSLLLLLCTPFGSTPCQAQDPPRRFTMAQVLSYPFPTDLIAWHSGNAFAWTSDARGVRNIWVAAGPDYRAHRVTDYTGDVGQEITHLHFS
ncbi:MAG: hypothetical protein KGL45_03155, partial [Gammaproteobacteria bacterium]|nr:hypothetical protein [Gammaproteobacteria bacterium]